MIMMVVCVCVIDDIANQRVYIKKIHIEDTHVRLESLNKDTYDNGELIYPDILLENTENLRLIGKVIDSFKPIEIKGSVAKFENQTSPL
ncbi:hypothetical protein [Pseudolactococcus raffinolactis]|uniref:hypothetical protein n=1 Tax=Pseudolactococcus raffinolactis TaxID=1366 RepID=UPI001436A9FB|nr:hypothetical protein [Lactococcus raffinolactis]QIW52228.1 hypothetical protein GU337_10235 [Lactococcus raffinolactis]